MLWELYQQRRIGEAESSAREARSQAKQMESRVAACEDKIDSLALASQAMWELLAERDDTPLESLREKMLEIDARDGKVDGKMSRVMRDCPACSRPLHARHRRCMYCGVEAPPENLLQS
ncbi:MAG: hypothetical protein ACE361_05905 [Aureliella sp.]